MDDSKVDSIGLIAQEVGSLSVGSINAGGIVASNISNLGVMGSVGGGYSMTELVERIEELEKKMRIFDLLFPHGVPDVD